MEVVLWLVLCVPGLIYSVWRMTTRKPACASCGGDVIALLSPRGRQLHAYYYPGQQLPP